MMSQLRAGWMPPCSWSACSICHPHVGALQREPGSLSPECHGRRVVRGLADDPRPGATADHFLRGVCTDPGCQWPVRDGPLKDAVMSGAINLGSIP